MNRVFSLLAAAAFAAASGSALAQDRDDRSDDRQLIVENVDDSATPSADRDVVEQTDVYIDSRGRHRHPRHGSPAPFFGALVGGLIGNQFGRGDGRAAATIAGAALGYAAGEASDRYDDEYDDRYAYDDYGPEYGYYDPDRAYPSFGYSIGFGYFGGGQHHRFGGHGYYGGHHHGR